MDREQISKLVYEVEGAVQQLKRSRIATDSDVGLRGPDGHLLWLIAGLNGGDSVLPSEIAKRLGVTYAAVTHHVNSLEERGLILRTNSPEDRRTVLLSLSPLGKKMLEKLKDERRSKLYELIEYLGEEDTEKLLSLMRRISDFVQDRKDGAC